MEPDQLSRRQVIRTVAALGISGGLAGCSFGGGDSTPTPTSTPSGTPTATPEPDTPTPTPEPEPTGDIQETKDELQKYTDPVTAWKDGYRNTVQYAINDDDSAAIGVPFVNSNVQSVDPLQPNMLLYDISDDGRYTLLGAEWSVPAESVDEAPRLFGEKFVGPVAPVRTHVPEQYVLRAWLFSENPEGQFARFNSALSPPAYANVYSDVGSSIRPFVNVTTARQTGFNKRGECRTGSNGSEGINYLSSSSPYNSSGSVYHNNFQSLLYEPVGGDLELVGVKWIVPVDEVSSRPSLLKQPMNGPIEGYFEGMPRHYTLNLWRKPNPNGLFARWNPAVTC